MSQRINEILTLTEKESVRSQATVAKAASVSARPEAGSRQSPLNKAKYCHHGFIPDYCAHCKYNAPVDWR